MSDLTRELTERLVRPALADLVPYQPGKPIEEVQRELGLERVIKLASNEGSWGPFPAALEALAKAALELNRYPDGGAYALRVALAERHDVAFEDVALGAGSDGLVDCVSQALLDPGDEIVCGWPSFPSYVIYARKLGAVPQLVPLRDARYDLEGLVERVGPRTKIVYVSYPNNPTGTMNSRAEVERFLDAVPEHVLVILDQAYFEYIDDPEYVDGIEEAAKTRRNVLALRTFSKIYGLAGLRIGYGIGPAPIVAAVDKVRRPFDLTSDAQAAAVASLDGAKAECARRRELTLEGRTTIEEALREHGFEVAGPAVANFVFAEVGDGVNDLYEALLRQGVIVRPTAGFGAPTAIRVTVGTPEENLVFAEALAQVRGAAGAPAQG